jgi:hypothetical protein
MGLAFAGKSGAQVFFRHFLHWAFSFFGSGYWSGASFGRPLSILFVQHQPDLR